MRHSIISTSLIAIAAVGMIGLAGCGREEPKQTAPGVAAPTNDVPDWVNDPSKGGTVLGAYGVAEKALAGEGKQVGEARQKARTELAATLGSKIQAVIKDWVREGGIITSQDNAQAAMVSFESASKNIINQNLSGSQQRERWVESSTGRMYVYMVVNPEIARKIAEETKAAARENKELRSHMAAKIEADKAFADLDKLIDKEMGLAK